VCQRIVFIKNRRAVVQYNSQSFLWRIMFSTEDVGQFELVIDFSERDICLSRVGGEIHSILVEISGVFIDEACEIVKDIRMEPLCSPLNDAQPCTWKDTPSTRVEKPSQSIFDNVHSLKEESLKEQGAPKDQIVAKKCTLPKVPEEQHTRKDLNATLARVKERNPVIQQQYRSREQGWNQYCTGANVPMSCKRTRCSLLGRCKNNPLLENVHAPANINAIAYKI
jgi:hypothetical protein